MLCEGPSTPHPSVSSLDHYNLNKTTQSFLGCGLINIFIIIDRLGCSTSLFVVGKIMSDVIVVVKFGEICTKFLSCRSCRISAHCSVIHLKCSLN